MSKVQKICTDHDIDLDDESEDSPSQANKDDWCDDDIDIEELIGKMLEAQSWFDCSKLY